MWRSAVDWLTYDILGMSEASRLGSAVNFFIYDTVKIFFLLAVIIFIVALVRSYFPPERTKKILAQGNPLTGNIAAALLGIVTPFCSCSAVPLFIGFVEAGIPLGVTFSFLISSPMVNEVALILLWGLFGWKIALLYIVSGLTVAVVGGWAIGKLRLESQVEEYVYKVKVGQSENIEYTAKERLEYAKGYVREIVGKVWPYVLVGIGLGGFIHGYAPEDFLLNYAGRNNPLAVPIAVLVGVPLYSNAAGTIPIVKVLMEKGMAMGTALAFMMAVTALSLPEMIILRRVLKPKLIAIFVSIISVAIIFTGYLFNALI